MFFDYLCIRNRRFGNKANQIIREKHTRIASWWDRKGENEIDIIAADELEQKVTFYEVKRQAKDINIGILKDKGLRCGSPWIALQAC